ncbi:hypothetical protein LT493_10135 [Streptomyces tricolor]|nr:hypothetical protein [Streptomyces tricolor]
MVRDRLGVKPLFWAAVDGACAFVSEPKALFAHPEIRPRVGADGLWQAYSLLFTTGPTVVRRPGGRTRRPAGPRPRRSPRTPLLAVDRRAPTPRPRGHRRTRPRHRHRRRPRSAGGRRPAVQPAVRRHRLHRP